MAQRLVLRPIRPIRPVALAAVVSLAALVAAPALAQSDGDTVSTPVQVSDLNLSSPEGARAALSRIMRAATQICGGEPSLMDMGRRQVFTRCRADTVQRSVAAAGQPMLSQLVPAPMGGAVRQLAAR